MTPESIPSGALKVAELLPCPFCGKSSIEMDAGDERVFYRCRCGSRGAVVYFLDSEHERDDYSESEALALEAWNTRAASPSPATGSLTFAQWADSLTTEDRYDFDSEGRGFKKDCGRMMRLAWDAALSSAKREAEPLTETKIEEGFPKSWLSGYTQFEAGVRFAECHHGITAAAKVEPEEKP